MTTLGVPVMFIIFIMFGFLAASAAMMALLNHLGAIPWRRSAHMHWAERARLLWPVRVTAKYNILLIALCAVLAAASEEEWQGIWQWFAAAGLIGAALGCYPLDCKIKRELTVKTWLYQCLVSWGSFAIRVAPLIAVVCYMPDKWSWELVPMVALCVVWLLWIATIGHVTILRVLGYLTPLPAEFADRLRLAFEKAQVFPKKLWLIRTPYLNAFALPMQRELMFSEALLRNCSPEEVSAICSHELAHLTEGRSAVIKRILVIFALFPLLFALPTIGSWGLIGMIPGLIWCALLIIFGRRLRRKFEVRADRVAAAQEENKGIYARALETLYRLNQIPAVMASKGMIHPHLYDRILAAGITPDFPRPKAPKKANWTVCVTIALAVAIFVARWL